MLCVVPFVIGDRLCAESLRSSFVIDHVLDLCLVQPVIGHVLKLCVVQLVTGHVLNLCVVPL